MMLGTACLVQAQQEPDVLYVPTPQQVVEKMLEVANINGDSVVYDLGCGDGRIVITAAKKFSARGLGIDIDPERIQESIANARKQGVADRVQFIKGDLFDLDLRPATAVMLYLLPQLNLRLRSRLIQQLKPGTPVVSHDFDMGDWEPERVEFVNAGSKQHIVYRWTVPARVDGTWQVKSSAGSQAFELQVRQDEFKIFVTRLEDGEETEMSGAKLQGNKISFAIDEDHHFMGQIKGDAITGTVTGPDGTGNWSLSRQASGGAAPTSAR